MLVIDKIPEMVQPNVYNVIDQMENNIIIIYFFSTVTLFFLYKNIFYKNIEAEICEILRIF